MAETNERQKLNRMQETKTHQTMIHSLLCEITGTLTADAAEGNTVLLRVRKRMDEIMENRNNVHPGRTAVNTRFAMGYSNDAYLNQACVPVWAGPGADEQHDLASDIPPQVRRAAAIGMLESWRSMLMDTRGQAERDLLAVASYVGWVLDVKEVRGAAIMIATEVDEGLKGVFNDLDNKYKTGSADAAPADPEAMAAKAAEERLRRNTVALKRKSRLGRSVSLATKADLADELDERVRAELARCPATVGSGGVADVRMVIEAACDSDASLDEVVCAATGAADASTRAYLTDLLLETVWAHEVGDESPAGMVVSSLLGIGVDADAASGSFSDADDLKRKRAEDLVGALEAAAATTTEDKNMGLALSVAFERSVDLWNSTNLGNGWFRRPGPSPFWKAVSTTQVGGKSDRGKASWENRVLKPDWAMRERPLTAKLLEKDLHNGPGELISGSVADGLMHEDMISPSSSSHFIAYVMLRGTCSLLGPHEEPIGENDPMRYTYPRGVIGTGSRGTLETLNDMLREVPVQKNAEEKNAEEKNADEKSYNTELGYLATINHTDAALLLLQGTKLNEIAPNEVDYNEPAREARWAPVLTQTEDDEPLSVGYNMPHAKWTSEASAYEVLIARLSIELSRVDQSNGATLSTRLKLMSVRAALKLQQLEALAHVATAEVKEGTGIIGPKDGHRLVTRPAKHVKEENDKKIRMLLPVSPGLTRFSANIKSTVGEPVTVPASSFNADKDVTTVCNGIKVSASDATRWLEEALELPLHVGARPSTQPYHQREETNTRTWGDAGNQKPEWVQLTLAHAWLGKGLEAAVRLRGVSKETRLAEQIDDPATEQHVKMFGPRDTETISRDRRGALWEECMRRVSVSPDRLLAFARKVAGKLGEDVTEILATGDAEMEAAQRELHAFRKQLDERTLQYTTNAARDVMSAVLKSSNIQLGFGNPAVEEIAKRLVVVNSALKESVEKLTTENRAFFQTSVTINDFLSTHPEELTLEDMLGAIAHVGKEFRRNVATELIQHQPGQRLSIETLSQPHNLYLVRFKPEFYAALGTAYQSFVVTMRAHYGANHSYQMRDISLWELVETDPNFLVLNETFSAYVAMATQWARNNAGKRAIYISQYAHQAVGNTSKAVRSQLLAQACHYLAHHQSPPQFLALGGREAYYGGRPELKKQNPSCENSEPQNVRKPKRRFEQVEQEVEDIRPTITNPKDYAALARGALMVETQRRSAAGGKVLSTSMSSAHSPSDPRAVQALIWKQASDLRRLSLEEIKTLMDRLQSSFESDTRLNWNEYPLKELSAQWKRTKRPMHLLALEKAIIEQFGERQHQLPNSRGSCVLPGLNLYALKTREPEYYYRLHFNHGQYTSDESMVSSMLNACFHLSNETPWICHEEYSGGNKFWYRKPDFVNDHNAVKLQKELDTILEGAYVWSINLNAKEPTNFILVFGFFLSIVLVGWVAGSWFGLDGGLLAFILSFFNRFKFAQLKESAGDLAGDLSVRLFDETESSSESFTNPFASKLKGFVPPLHNGAGLASQRKRSLRLGGNMTDFLVQTFGIPSSSGQLPPIFEKMSREQKALH